ncbi:cytochrome P450 67 [Diaporthe sp. PMI_573]|nr:cytochrome P450 67 [Diaporthaceae sp. PMI_573]
MVQSLPHYAAQASSDPAFIGAALLGVLFHVSIQLVEFERFMFHYLAALPVMALGMTTVLSDFGRLAWSQAIVKSIFMEIIFNLSFLLSIGVYRMLLHRCRGFPGPVGARLSRFWTAYISGKNLQYYKDLEKMQAKYGDFVRTGPREITVFRDSAVTAIYGPASKLLKSTWYGQSGNDPDQVSLHMVRDPARHRNRRRAWDRGFAIKALANYEPRVKEKADLLTERMRERARQPVNITKWAMFYSFDVIGEVAFSKDFGNLMTGTEHSALIPIHEHIKALGVLSPVPWLMNILTCLPAASNIYTEIFAFCADEIQAKQKSWNSEKFPSDIVSWMLKAVHDKDVSAAPTPEALEYDSRLVLLAGSDTASSTLSNALFFLCKDVGAQTKLREQLRQAMTWEGRDYEKVQFVTFLDDIIAETLRLRPAVLVAGSRETPAAGLQIDEMHIPGNTNVLVPVYNIQRDQRYWPQANEFIPERWGDRRSEMGTDNAPYFPFLAGMYSCPGKNLAYMSLRIALATLVQNFDISFAEGEDGTAFEKEALDTFVVTLPPLHIIFAPL